MAKSGSTQNKSVFISHATKDKPIVDKFVDDLLIGVLQLKVSNVFYTSGYGTKIKSGEDWRNEIRDNLLKADVVLLFISPYYKESEMCLCEMGAAWTTNNVVLPVIIPPVNYKTVGIVYEPNQIENLLDEDALERIKDILIKELAIDPLDVKSDRWAAKRRIFLSEVETYFKSHPFPNSLTRDTLDKLEIENESLNQTIKGLLEEVKTNKEYISELEKLKDAAAVKTVKAKKGPSRELNEFEELAEAVREQLTSFDPIIKGLIFLDYNGKPLDIDLGNHRTAIKEAASESYLSVDEEGEIEMDWSTTKIMMELQRCLRELDDFMHQKHTPEFVTDFNSKYAVPFKIDNKSFWEKVFRKPIWIS